MKTHILIITALETELNRKALPHIPNTKIHLVYSGVGKINASLATLKAIEQHQPKLIINFGTVGKINQSLEGLLEISKVLQRDMDAEPLAPRGRTPFCDRPSEYHSSGLYVCGSGDSFVTSSDAWLIDQEIDVVDMELFAIAAVAHQYSIPWRSFKYISDAANEDAGQEWHQKVNHGQELYLDALNKVLGISRG
jgi:adenosylhomocysteine nucleosidase